MKGELFSGEVFLKPHIACPNDKNDDDNDNDDVDGNDNDGDGDDDVDGNDNDDECDGDDSLACPSIPSIRAMRAAFSPIDLGDVIAVLMIC